MKHCVKLIFVLASLLSCNSETDIAGVATMLDKAESMMNEYPDSSLYLIDSLGLQKDRFPRDLMMRYELLRANAQNKAYVDFTTDSVMKLVVDYYDRYGDSNEMMLAHYLLGCTYRDMNEAPLALSSYYDAIDHADTLRDDCDYYTLAAVYGQIADVLDAQLLPYDEIWALKEYSKCSERCNDTIEAIHGIQLLARPYIILRDTVKWIESLDMAHDRFLSNGYEDYAVRTYANKIHIDLVRGNIGRAKGLMDEYETKSGLFDADGNIADEHKFYYYNKGLYYQLSGNLDSAEYYYRRLLKSEFKYDAYRGLIHVYKQYGKADSVMLYAEKMSNELDTLLSDRYFHAMRQVMGMYDYTRNEKIAFQKTSEATRNKLWLILVAVLSIAVMLAIWAVQHRIHKRKDEHASVLAREYSDAVGHLADARRRLASMMHERDDRDATIAALSAECRENEEKLSAYMEMLSLMSSSEKEEVLKNSDIVKRFKAITSMPLNYKLLTDKDWQELKDCIRDYLPLFYNNICNVYGLDLQELYVALLVGIGFSTSDISILLNTSSQRISNLKQKINQELFNEKDARRLKRNMDKLKEQCISN